MVSSNELIQLRKIAPSVWSSICRQIDGLAVSSTIAALNGKGLFQLLLEEEQLSMKQIRQHYGGQTGYLHIAMRILDCQAWIKRSGPSGSDEMHFELTAEGQELAQLSRYYQVAASCLPLISQVINDWHKGQSIQAGQGLRHLRKKINKVVSHIEEKAPAYLQQKIKDHLQSHLILPVMAMLSYKNIFPPPTEIIDQVDLASYNGSSTLLRQAFECMEELQWASIDKQIVSFSPEGKVAVNYAKQYWYPLSYLETLIRVPRLLFGEPSQFHFTSGEKETHVDRLLDIQFSGAVFDKTCKKPFLDLALPLFNTPDLAQQAKVIVDMGCGNGALLQGLYEAIRNQTLRGQQLDQYPLLMIGVEPSSVARETTEVKLIAAGIPAKVISGNIADPQALAEDLQALGIALEDILHVSKSVIHNRPYSQPQQIEEQHRRIAYSSSAFATPAGEAIPNTAMEQHLVEHFRKWKPLCRAHGMLVVEGHATPPALIAQLNGRSISTIMEATHGYSNQYLVEPEVFNAAAEEAGFHSRAHRAIGKDSLGHVILTINHFVVEE